MSSSIYFSNPPRSIFKFPPDNEPQTLPPALPGTSVCAPPFEIPADLYNAVLDIKVPITIACVYAASVTALNAYNRSRGNKPWWVSTTRLFFWFVVVHNILLAVYSGWTFVGMWDAVKESIVPWTGAGGIVATVDSLCRIQGPRGLGNAIAYNSTANAWVSQAPSTVFLKNGVPDNTDQGRLWNQGLAFYGWFFYLSKFYEVLDTVIILAKGKRSSTLQTYHHAGAMMCMWSGIRYMSAPIWLFVFLNSGIHTLMYTYYTLTAFSVRIPNALKRSLTTMQIMQFLIGVVYAAAHSFISYDIPVRVPVVKEAVAAISTAASSAVSSATAVAATATIVDMIKKYIFRAIGEQGLAGNMDPKATSTFIPLAPITSNDGIQNTTQYQTVPCVDTSGQTFAIWFNVFYLTPLTFLFARFFVKSYLRKGATSAKLVKKLEKNGSANGYANGTPKKTNGYANGNANGNANGKH